MKPEMTFSILKIEFSPSSVCFSIRALRRTLALNTDFSQRHLCPNPPALAGGRLTKDSMKARDSHIVSLVFLYGGNNRG